MQFAELSTVKHLVQVGVPLPFNVRHADTTLLLARGHKIDSQEQLDALFARGALVDMAELRSQQDLIRLAPRDLLPSLWGQCLHRVADVLQKPGQLGFSEALIDASAPVQALIARDPDLAIFQVLRQSGNADISYGAQRSLQTAITSHLVAQRLGWAAPQAELAFKVALTSNLAMLELQGLLARQTQLLTEEQKAQCRNHPLQSARMLEQAGVTDTDWLRAVERHHEREDGSGYPAGHSDVGEVAALVRRADIYTSKLAGRSSRDALAADQAGRQMFMQESGNPMTAALVKEFGIYPPGCMVRLVSGELALVIGRGPSINAPIVSCLTNARGTSIDHPVRVSTAEKGRGVVGVVGESQFDKPQPTRRLLAALAA